MQFSKELSEEERQASEEAIRMLIRRGELAGELTYTEIVAAFSGSIIDVDALGQIVTLLREAGIKVIHVDGSFEDHLERALIEEGRCWILASSLTERAFWIGACEAAKLLGADEKRIFWKVFGKTIWERGADDTFPCTTVGKSYTKLLELVRDGDVRLDDLREPLDMLEDSLHEVARNWRKHSDEVERLIQALRCRLELTPKALARQPDEQFDKGAFNARDLIRAIERPLRQLALLQTSHKLQDRFKELD